MSNNKSILSDYVLHLADNALIFGQRNSEWCGHGPVLEQDIAITNISLDLIGQARSLYQYCAELKGNGATEDSLAYLRDAREYKNCLLVELPKGDWAQTITRQFFFQQLPAFAFYPSSAINRHYTLSHSRKIFKRSYLPCSLEQRMDHTPGRWHGGK